MGSLGVTSITPRTIIPHPIALQWSEQREMALIKKKNGDARIVNFRTWLVTRNVFRKHL